MTQTKSSYAQVKAVWKEIKSTYFIILCVQKNKTYIQKIKGQKNKQPSHHRIYTKTQLFNFINIDFFSDKFLFKFQFFINR